MPLALKAQWHVSAGLIPGEPMAEYTRGWNYTSADYDADGDQRGEVFESLQEQAQEYASQLMRGGLNWVDLQYIWV